MTVYFFENEVANANENTKPQNTLIAKSDDDLKQTAIAYLQGQCPDLSVSTITETTDGLTAKFSLNSHHEIVNAVLMTLGKITEDEAWNYDQQGRCGVAISHPETHASLQNSTPQAINNSGVGDTVSDDHAKVDQLGQDCHKSILSQQLASKPKSDNLNLSEVFGVCGTDHKAMMDVRQSSTSHTDGGSEMTNTADRHHDKSIFSKQPYHKTSAANLTAEDIKMPVIEVTQTKPLRSAINSNTVNLMEAFNVRGTDNQNVKKEISTTQTDGGSVVDNTAERHHDKSIFSKQACHKTSAENLTAEDIKMPVVEKEVLRKDWASLADQRFYDGMLPDSQKIALVAIIDYVKRKNVIIGSDAEIYRWLYHTVSHHERYYSRATNFKHLANILIKQLMNKRFEKAQWF